MIDVVSWSKGDQEEKGESTEHDPMNRCQEVESKECGRMKGVPYSYIKGEKSVVKAENE